MIGLPAGTRIWMAAGVTDMRCGFNGLAAKVQTALAEDPFSGHVFFFRGRRGDILKILWCATLKAMIVNRDVALTSQGDTLAQLREELSTRGIEIEHLKLLIAKLKRMQFGHKWLSPCLPILTLLPAVFKTFTKRYPKVKLHLMEATFPTTEPLLRDGRLDCYINGLVGDTVHRPFQRNLLFHNRRFVFARKGHPLMHAKTLQDLQDATWVCGGIRQRPEQDMEELFQSHGLEAPTRITRLDSQMCMLVLILHTNAVALVPQQWAEAAVINELISPIRLTNDFPAPDVVLITRSGIPLTPSSEKLSDLFIRKANALYQ